MRKTIVLSIILSILIVVSGCTKQIAAKNVTKNSIESTTSLKVTISTKSTLTSTPAKSSNTEKSKPDKKYYYVAKPVVLTKENQSMDTAASNKVTDAQTEEVYQPSKDVQQVQQIASTLPDFFKKDQVDWHWINTDYLLNSIVSNGSVDIAVGTSGIIKRSTDDKNWETIQLHKKYDLYKVVWHQNRFIAFGDDGVILTSTNGEKWAETTFPTKDNLLFVAAGKNEIVTVTEQGSVFVSKDSDHWTKLNISFENELTESTLTFPGVTQFNYEHDHFIFTYKGHSFISSIDGTTWVKTVLPIQEIDTILFNGTNYLVYGIKDKKNYEQVGLQSEDLINWDNINFVVDKKVEYGGMQKILNHETYNHNNKFYAITQTTGIGDCGYLIDSSDGVTWNYLSNDVLCALTDLIHHNNIFIGVGGAGTIVTSGSNKIKWMIKEQKLGYISDFHTIGNKVLVDSVGAIKKGDWDINNVNDMYSLYGEVSQFTEENIMNQGNDIVDRVDRHIEAGTILKESTDGGQNWKDINKNEQVIGTIENKQVEILPTKMAKTSRTYTLIAQDITPIFPSKDDPQYYEKGDPFKYQAIFLSTDHLKHLNGVFKSNTNLNDIVATDNQFVVIGDNGLIAASTDGVHWDMQKSNTTQNLNKIVWIGKQYIAVGDQGVILTSKDGVTWKKIQLAKPLNLANIAWNSDSYLVSDKFWDVFALSRNSKDWELFKNNMDVSISTFHGNDQGYTAVGDGVINFQLINTTGISIPQKYIDYMKTKDSDKQDSIVYYAKKDIDLDGQDEVIIASGKQSDTENLAEISHIYVLRNQNGSIFQIGDNLAITGTAHSVNSIKLIRLQNMQQSYIYLGISNDMNIFGFEILELTSDKMNTIALSISPSGPRMNDVVDSDHNGEIDGYDENSYGYDVFYYLLVRVYRWKNAQFVFDHTAVDVSKYPVKIKEVLVQYLTLRTLDAEKSSEVSKRLSELCIDPKANDYQIPHVWYDALIESIEKNGEELTLMDDQIQSDIKEKNNAATAKITTEDTTNNNKEYTIHFHLIKNKNKWQIDKIY